MRLHRSLTPVAAALTGAVALWAPSTRADPVSATGKGESEPVASNTTADGKALNRRVDVVRR